MASEVRPGPGPGLGTQVLDGRYQPRVTNGEDDVLIAIDPVDDPIVAVDHFPQVRPMLYFGYLRPLSGKASSRRTEAKSWFTHPRAARGRSPAIRLAISATRCLGPSITRVVTISRSSSRSILASACIVALHPFKFAHMLVEPVEGSRSRIARSLRFAGVT
jgi:hypothetical protein